MTQPADNSDHDKANGDEAGPKTTPDLGKSEAAKPDADKKAAAEAGTALATSASSPVNPFLAAAASEEKIDTPIPPRTIAARMLDYSAHAAIIVGLIGFAWTVSDHVVSRPVAKIDTPAALAATTTQPAKLDEMAELRLTNQKMHDEIRALKASVDSLRTTVRRDTTPEQVRVLTAGLEAVKSNVGAVRTETGAAIAQIAGKVDKLQPGKVQQLTERVGRLEHQAVDTNPTGSIGKSDAGHSDARAEPRADVARNTPKPPPKPTALASAEEPRAAPEEDKPQVISGWVVRDVYQGVALVEGRRGTMEVVPGVSIPGAGVVKSIERHNGSWTVLTSKGQLAYSAPQHDSRRGSYGRGGYPPYRYDY